MKSMDRNKLLLSLLFGLAMALLLINRMAGSTAAQELAAPAGGAPVTGPAFTYQGYLELDGVPVDAACDFQFSLYYQVDQGTPLTTVSKPGVPVAGGYFTTLLDFGQWFDGTARYLETTVDCGGGAVTLSPRTQLTAAPYATYALNNWGLSGNYGTDPAVQFLGTTDNVTMTFRANNTVALRLSPSIGTPNLIGGSGGNFISSTVQGGTIGGGGAFASGHVVRADFATIGGGNGNQATGANSTVAGGASNNATAINAAVAGGFHNIAANQQGFIGGGASNRVDGMNGVVGGGGNNLAAGDYSAITGGVGNEANEDSAAVAGGWTNIANGRRAFIGGGAYNNVLGSYGAIGGGGGDNLGDGNLVVDNYGTIGGGYHNIAGDGNGVRDDATHATVGGGNGNHAFSSYSFVGGGSGNMASGQGAVVGGGTANQVSADWGTIAGGGGAESGYGNRVTDHYGTVGGGSRNLAGDAFGQPTSAHWATVGGGSRNEASGGYSFVGGGAFNRATSLFATTAGGTENESQNSGATVSGGYLNVAAGQYASIAGGADNQVLGGYSAISGGSGNVVTSTFSVAGGGLGNRVGGSGSVIAGGAGNYTFNGYSTVAGGTGNQAIGNASVVAGGSHNVARGYRSAIPGGQENQAQGDYSFAAGREAIAQHNGAFVWADGIHVPLTSQRANQFLARASGGFRFQTQGSGTNPAGVLIDASGLDVVGLYVAQNSSDSALVLSNRGSGELIKAFGDANSNNLKFMVTQAGNVTADGTFSGGGADFAEMVAPGQSGLEPGDVLAIGPDGTFVRSSEPYQSSVAGVFSTEPGFLGGNFTDENGDPLNPDHIPLAVVGIVPVKVTAENGPIAAGDLLTASSLPGHAMKASPIHIEGFSFYPSGVIVGKALESFDGGTGFIMMLVTLQ